MGQQRGERAHEPEFGTDDMSGTTRRWTLVCQAIKQLEAVAALEGVRPVAS